MGPIRRNRKMSLSGDWDRLIAEASGIEGIGKLNIFRKRDVGYQEIEDHEEKVEKPIVDFCTESSYIGQWDSLGMSGFGTYVFPHGVEYEGHFRDGMFDGEGTLIYPMGQKIEGKWIKGTLVLSTFRLADGLEYSETMDYCSMPDRRFFISMTEGLRPAGREYLTNEQPTRVIPDGCYDTGRGFFDPKTKCITGALDTNTVYQKIQDANIPKMLKVVGDVYERPQVSIATEAEEEWIVQNCRKAWDEPTGYRPDLYERWVSGRAADFLAFDPPSSSSTESISYDYDDSFESEYSEISF